MQIYIYIYLSLIMWRFVYSTWGNDAFWLIFFNWLKPPPSLLPSWLVRWVLPSESILTQPQLSDVKSRWHHPKTYLGNGTPLFHVLVGCFRWPFRCLDESHWPSISSWRIMGLDVLQCFCFGSRAFDSCLMRSCLSTIQHWSSMLGWGSIILVANII